ncbi:MAG: hypothetical protein A2583_12010 [Bdellovibrionales bacterium RIFOXYD1_FULL_53_11]|nr:MAG: hypothetical protein A2583_12010 [Bdellovibrionales bacterium RIFOXYD1_FULL_53_11]
MDKIFEYDRIIEEDNFCNFDQEKEFLKKHLDSDDCVKIFGPRNFGKTSLIRNIIAPKGEARTVTEIALDLGFFDQAVRMKHNEAGVFRSFLGAAFGVRIPR